MPIARPEIRAAREPLTQEEFKRAIEQGLGRAILCLQKHDPQSYKEIILEACLKDTAYVRHFSYNKAAYFNELLSAFTDAFELKKQILKAFKNSIPDEQDRPKTALILEFAKAGMPNARDAIYDDFLKATEMILNWDAGDEIIELDGLPGLLFVAPYFGKMVNGKYKSKIPWYYIRDLSDELGADTITQAFVDLNNPDAFKFLEFSRSKLKTPYKNPEYKNLPFSWAIDKIFNTTENNRVSLFFWGQYASVEALIGISNLIPTIQDAAQLARALSVFEKQSFPLDYTPLLGFCRHENEKVVQQAALALSWFSDPEIRALAFEFLANSDTEQEGLYLLELNLEEQDWAFLEQLTEELSDDRCEELTVRICEIAKTNPSIEAQKTLLQLYEAGSCASCRGNTVEKMHALNCLPDWILEEMLLDGYDYNREKARAWADVTA